MTDIDLLGLCARISARSTKGKDTMGRSLLHTALLQKGRASIVFHIGGTVARTLFHS